MGRPVSYNGHRSWNAWNVALWLGNDEALYNHARRCFQQAKNNPARAARLFMRDYRFGKTPDGAVYTLLAVRLAMEGLFVE